MIHVTALLSRKLAGMGIAIVHHSEIRSDMHGQIQPARINVPKKRTKI